MYKILSLICIIAAAVTAFFLASWIKSRRGSGDDTVRLYGIIKSRNSNFWAFHYIPVIAFTVLIALAAGAGIDWIHAAACLAGSIISFLAVYAGSVAFVPGSVSSYSQADAGDIRTSIRASYRSGAVLGLCISALVTAVLLAAFQFLKTETVMGLAGSFAMGASVVAVILHTGGDVYSSAYALAVPSGDFTDRTGFFTGAGSDIAETYILSAAAVIMLADAGVAASGVTSTFTNGAASRFVLVIYAAGIAGCVVGVFLQKAGIGNDPSRGADIGLIAAGIIATAVCSYFSNVMLQSFVYTVAVGSGILAGIILMEISRFFSPDSKIFKGVGKNLGKYAPAVFNMGRGMVSTAVTAVLLIAAIGVSYSFAGYYGLALCAAGLASMTAAASALTSLSVISAQTSEILSSALADSEEPEREKMSDAVDVVADRNGIMSKTYRTAAGFMSAFALFCAFAVTSQLESMDIMALKVFAGIIVGICSAFAITGIIVGSVNVTGRVARRDMGRSDDETGSTSSLRGAAMPAVIAIAFPALIGLLSGPASLAGFLVAVISTSLFIVTGFNNSGRYLENTAIQSLASVVKLMTVFSVAFLPVFIEVGGFLF